MRNFLNEKSVHISKKSKSIMWNNLLKSMFKWFNIVDWKLIRKCDNRYPAPFPIEITKQSWNDNYPEYSPIYFLHKSVRESYNKLGEPMVDHEDLVTAKLKERFSYENWWKLRFDKNWYPLNPMWRIWISGRGLMWRRWPNHAADPIIIFKKNNWEKQVLLIERPDAKWLWAFPGWICDPWEEIKLAAFRELEEETGLNISWLKDLNERLKFVFWGVVDDPRNTDNAWIESHAILIEINESEVPWGLNFRSHSEEARRIKLVNISELIDKNGKVNKSLFYASHGLILQKYLDKNHWSIIWILTDR